MVALTAGQSATVTVTAGGSVTIQAGGFGRIRQGGQDQHFGPSQSTFGPYSAQQDVQITADSALTYVQAAGGQSVINGQCTDLSTAVALLNQIRGALIAAGLCI